MPPPPIAQAQENHMLHPDTLIDALKKELRNHPENKEGIEKEIKFYESQPKPAVLVDGNNQTLVKVDRKEQYLTALRAEQKKYPERDAEIQTEIDRVEGRSSKNVERAVRSTRGVQKAVVDNDLPEV
jgi:hypothetical protein